MDFNVHVSYEEARECGFRKPAADGVGIYLMGDGIFEPCERLPFPLSVCPCCGAGIRFSRGFTWIDPAKLFAPHLEPVCDGGYGHQHEACALCNPAGVGERAGLMWVGKKHYSPASFTREAMGRGISKKLSGIPRDLRVGEDVIYLAHIEAVIEFDGVALNGKGPTFSAGVFMVFRPTHVDLVIEDEHNIPERALHIAEALGDKARLVKVMPVREEQGSLL